MNWDELTDRLTDSGALSADWEETFRALPRDRFMPARIYHAGKWIDRETEPILWSELACSDLPLVTQLYEGTDTPSSSSSMPTVVATMLRHLDVADGMRVMEVGTGTGWTAGLLSHRLGADNVVSLEVDPTLAADARARLDGLACGPGWWSRTACSVTPTGHRSNGCI